MCTCCLEYGHLLHCAHCRRPVCRATSPGGKARKAVYDVEMRVTVCEECATCGPPTEPARVGPDGDEGPSTADPDRVGPDAEQLLLFA